MDTYVLYAITVWFHSYPYNPQNAEVTFSAFYMQPLLSTEYSVLSALIKLPWDPNPRGFGSTATRALLLAVFPHLLLPAFLTPLYLKLSNRDNRNKIKKILKLLLLSTHRI